jgi:hypothetical protein
MRQYVLVFALTLAIFPGTAPADQTQVQAQAQAAPGAISHAVDPANRYHRLICLVHLTGSGTKTDPTRPEYTPTSIDPSRAGIIAWSFQLTDDGTMAIVHYVAVNRSAFAAILADTRAEIRVFEIGKAAPAAIEAEMQKYKANFTLKSLQVVAQ